MSESYFSTFYRNRAWPPAWTPSDDRRSSSMVLVDLAPYFDNTAFCDEYTLANGCLNIWRNSFPLEEASWLPQEIDVAGIRFVFPKPNGVSPDNIRCSGQIIEFIPQLYDWIYVLCSAERRVEDEVVLLFSDGSVDFAPFCVADFWPGARPRSGEIEAMRFATLNFPRHRQDRIEPAIWRQRIPVARETPLKALRLPNNIAAHVFAMTCRRAEETRP